MLQQKQEKLEDRQGKLETEVGEIKIKVLKNGTELDKRLEGYIEIECQKKLEDNKRLLNEWIVKMSEKLKFADENHTSWKEVASKEVEDRLMVINMDLTVVKKCWKKRQVKLKRQAS
jgi:hypothetical protein